MQEVSLTSEYCVSICCRSELIVSELQSLWVLQIDELLKQWNEIHASYTIAPQMKRSTSKSRSKGLFRETKEEGQLRDKKASMKDRTKKKKWFNIHLKVDKRKPC